MSGTDDRRPGWGDSVWCGGVACVCILAMDVVALFKGGRHQVPAGAVGIAVAGLVLPVLNLYFLLKDVLRRRWKQAGLGALLTAAALLFAFAPPWGSLVLEPSKNAAGRTSEGRSERWRYPPSC